LLALLETILAASICHTKCLKHCGNEFEVAFRSQLPFLVGHYHSVPPVSPYTHRVAISHHRLKELKDGKVTFTYKDYKHEQRQKLMTVSARRILEALPAACSSALVSAHPPLRPSRQSSSRGTPGPLPRTTGYAPAHPTTDSQLPGLLPATHWDRSAPVPQMQSWHDGAHRRPSPCQACRHLEHLMSSASILPCLIANLQLTPPFGIRVPQSWPLLVHMSLPAFHAGPFSGSGGAHRTMGCNTPRRGQLSVFVKAVRFARGHRAATDRSRPAHRISRETPR
jgi:hypothetical protein